MSWEFGVTVASIVLTALIGLPIGHAMLASSVLYLLLQGQDLSIAFEQMLTGLYGSYVLLAIPLFIFAADLIRALHRQGLEPEIDFIFLASYGTGTTGGTVEILRDVESAIEGRDVVIVDDILDSGRTLLFAKERLAARGARSVRACVLLDKKARRLESVTADFTGFECPNRFVVGYGMDIANRYRELPFIGVIETDD